MPRFAANLTMMFTEYPTVERVHRAAEVGFKGVELLFPYGEDIDGIVAALDEHEMALVNFNLPVGDFAAGERGYANDPRRVDEFRESVAGALALASRLNAPKINCLIGRTLEDVALDAQWATVYENLAYAAGEAERIGVLQLVEPLNPFDAPGFLLPTPSAGFALVEAVGHPNLKLEYDVYHAQRTEGNLTQTIRDRIAQIGHVQIADSPGRNQPGTGEINYPYVFNVLDEVGYDGWVALEYRPAGTSEASVSWIAEYGY